MGIRYNAESVLMTLSLESYGDIEVVIAKEDARKLIDALGEATS